MAQPFVMSPEEVVDALYKHLLGRDPDGSQGWVDVIRQSNDPTLALKGVLESEEFRIRQRVINSPAGEGETNAERLTQRLFFFHNPKAGGMSLMHLLERSATGMRICPMIENTICSHAGHNGDYSAFRGYDLYIGHYGRDVFDAVRDNHAYMSNFRHPVSRIISLYNYFRLSIVLNETLSAEELIDHACVRAAKDLSLDDFVACEDPRVRVYTSDYHFRQLAGSPWVAEPPHPSVEEICRFIDGMVCFYVCEYRDLSVRFLRQTLGVWSVPNDNVTRTEGSIRMVDIDERTLRRIMNMNRRDMAIYEHAVRRLFERNGL